MTGGLEALEALAAYDSKSIDAPAEQNGFSLSERLQTEDRRMRNIDDRLVIEDAIAKLPQRSRQVLDMRYNEDMTQSEIAQIIGVSQMQVSRLLTAAIEELGTIIATESSESEGSF